MVMNSPEKPKLSIIMPVYNSEKYLRESTESILNQTFKDFEFIIINDGSTDSSMEIVKSYKDPRIKIYDLSTNHGIVYCLNFGIEKSESEIIARMDADDISIQNRIEIQYNYLLNNPTIGLVSSQVQLIDSSCVKERIWKQGGSSEDIFYKLHFVNCIAHPSVIFRKKLVLKAGLYKKEALHMEDFDLWYRLSKITKIFEIPKVLLNLRKTESNISFQNYDLQIENASGLSQKTLKNFINTNISKEQILSIMKNRTDFKNIKDTISLLKSINYKILEQESIIIKELNLNYINLYKSMLTKKLIIIINVIRFAKIQDTIKNVFYITKILLLTILEYTKLYFNK
jgi:glycosyltransferase involved in cell wall biosynthesis